MLLWALIAGAMLLASPPPTTTATSRSRPPTPPCFILPSPPPPQPFHPRPLHVTGQDELPKGPIITSSTVTIEETRAIDKWARRRAWWLLVSPFFPPPFSRRIDRWFREGEAKLHLRRLPYNPIINDNGDRDVMMTVHHTPPVLSSDHCQAITREMTPNLPWQPWLAGDGYGRAAFIPLSHVPACIQSWEQASASKVLVQSIAYHYHLPPQHLHIALDKAVIVSLDHYPQSYKDHRPSWHRTPSALCFSIPLATNSSSPAWLSFHQEEDYYTTLPGTAYVFSGGRRVCHLYPPDTGPHLFLMGQVGVHHHPHLFLIVPPRWFTSSDEVGDQEMVARLWRAHGIPAVVRSLTMEEGTRDKADVVRYRLVKERPWRRLLRGLRGKDMVEWHWYGTDTNHQVGRLGFRLVRGAERPALRATFRSLLGSNIPPKVALLIYIFVEPEYRGRGLGEAMLDDLRKALSSEGFNILMLSVDDNGSGDLVRYYERLGYTVVPDLSMSGTPIMVKSLLSNPPT